MTKYEVTVWDWMCKDTITLTAEGERALEVLLATLKGHGNTFRNPQIKEVTS